VAGNEKRPSAVAPPTVAMDARSLSPQRSGRPFVPAAARSHAQRGFLNED